jgi:hypothetical protein
MVHERFDLWSPVRQILHFIQEDVGGFARMRGLVERAAEYPILVPANDSEDRRLETPQGRKFVELHTDDAAGTEMPLCEQVLNRLLLKRRFADLPRAPQHDRGGYPGIQPAQQRVERTLARTDLRDLRVLGGDVW